MSEDEIRSAKPRDLASAIPPLVTLPVRSDVDTAEQAPRLKRKPQSGGRPMRDTSSLTREIQPMPADVREALEARSLTAAYEERPPYQRNDYLAWIARARRPETRQKRLNQMLEELAHGGIYMGMRHTPSA